MDKLNEMYKFTHRTPVLISVMLPHWGFDSGKSANGMKLVAALKSYGLIGDQGLKENRKINITENGFKLLNLVKDSSEYKEKLREAALSPEMYQYMWDTFDELPHFDAIKSHLVVEKKFNESAVKGFLDDYKQTIDFAELSKSDSISKEEEREEESPNIEVGDLVQWELEGVFQFEKPKVVRAIKQLDGTDWIFVEGSETGVPMNQVILEQKGTAAPGGAGMKHPILPEYRSDLGASLKKDEKEFLRGQLSKSGTGYRIIVSGDLGPKEIDKLIRALEVQRDILSDDEE